ncbi:Enhanced entry protein EnhA homolog [Legionella wadsworthii]|uniref:Enhanced entry protein EnhA homolog n=1 Tax=Legionella wadsworthii TaxID=28088 RepID=A0A378LXM4_9GAMM|nr:L,D-transpeptidase [Legionella wadsworthii]STY28821.1 Enhanced entry protein EnhA homolog [Legionella wadsworthii]
MKKKLVVIIALLISTHLESRSYYGSSLCIYKQYDCLKISQGDTWKTLFPDPNERDIVQRLNRSYNSLSPGKEIAVPVNLAHLDIFDISPFPLNIDTKGEKQVIVDQEKLAWAAYDSQGYLIKWGPISSGRDKCNDSSDSCRTLTGRFRIFSKEGKECHSNTYDNAQMPYCMYFHKGFALHGSNDIPGFRASHGCVRMFVKDAKWMNQKFIELSHENNNFHGTIVIVKPLLDEIYH